MMKFRLSRAIAAALALSLVVSAPGSQAWGQVAAAIRPGSMGAGLVGAAGSITPVTGSITTLSLTAPLSLSASPSLSAPALSAPAVSPRGAAPVAAALSGAAVLSALSGSALSGSAFSAAAVVPAPLLLGKPVAAAPLPSLSKPEALTASLSAAAVEMNPASAKNPSNAFDRMSSFFDGLLARRPTIDAVDAPVQREARSKSGLGHSRQPIIPVLVTIADPISVDAVGLVLTKLYREHGFTVDESWGVLRGPAGVLTVRGALPVGQLQALRAAPGVVAVKGASGPVTHLKPALEGAKTEAPALSSNPPSAPSTPEGPKAGNLRFRTAAPASKRQPFVPATRVVADMEKLLKTDPAEALKVAAAAIVTEQERRAEVKIGAQRILGALPIEQTLPHYVDLLKLAARTGIQTSKDVNIDPWWYLQRTALNRIAREAAALKPGTPELVDALKTAYKDRNSSVRLAAAGALTALGIEPGVEASYDTRSEAAPGLTPGRPSAEQAKKRSYTRWFSILLLAGALGWMVYSTPSTPPAAAPTAITQPVKAPDSAAVKAPAGAQAQPSATVTADPKDAALAQIAADTKRTADAAERTAKAAEDMAKPKGSFLSTLLWTLGPILLLVFLMRKFMGGQAGGISTKAKMGLERPKTRFDDVAGIDETLVEVQEIIDFLRDPARFRKLGGRMPKGILMEGPPGTGKTLLAKALAGETDATFISISGSDFVELYVGMGARRVRELFETARKNAPAIIFIDEIDAVGKKRGDGGPGGGGNDEREQTINQILKEMDGFDNSSGVLVVAATNRADTLDAALTRPGRFDRKIHVGLPEAMGREAILALHAKKARLSPEVDLRLIARRTAGLSGAFLENVINESALLAARRGADSISAADIDEAVDRATIGGKRSLRLSDVLKRRIAAHEAGHVLANLLNEKAELRVPVNKVTIMPHGSGALGFAESGTEEGDKYLYTRGELEARLDTALGGLVAEKIFYGEWSTGPGSDLEAATRVARAMVQQLGMSEAMGLAQTAPNQYGQSTFGGEVDAKALAEINKLLKLSMERTEARLRAGGANHAAMIEALMEKETLSADEIEAIAHPKPKP